VLDSGDIAALSLLDLSAAFDTADHSILLRRLQRSYGLNGSAIAWFGSYLNQRQQHVTHLGVESVMTTTQFGVILGPILFMLYTADVVRLVQLHGFNVHLYADDTQLYGCCHPDNSASLSRDLGICVEDVARWMCSNQIVFTTIRDHPQSLCCWPQLTVKFHVNLIHRSEDIAI